MKYLILALMLSGCASFEGVKMDEDERKACAVATCSVWTDKELRALGFMFYQRGYQAGKNSI